MCPKAESPFDDNHTEILQTPLKNKASQEVEEVEDLLSDRPLLVGIWLFSLIQGCSMASFKSILCLGLWRSSCDKIARSIVIIKTSILFLFLEMSFILKMFWKNSYQQDLMYSLKIENSYMLMICKRQACKPSCFVNSDLNC